jgi:enoyl-CoA hydratase/carnithine racemase
LKLTLETENKSQNRIAFLEFCHGKANEMGSKELGDLELLCEWLEAGEVSALISFSRRLTEKGTPIFIAGANVTERTHWEESRIKAHVRRQRAVLARLRHAPVFHVGVINGVALGWGTEFLICCDYRVAAKEARFGLPETGLGILPGAGGTSELWAMIGLSQALRLGMTGQLVEAEEALRIGLVQEVVSDMEAALSRARVLCELVSRRSPTAVAAFKAGALASVGLPEAERREVEALAYEHCVGSGEAAIGRGSFEAIRSGKQVNWGPLQPYKP